MRFVIQNTTPVTMIQHKELKMYNLSALCVLHKALVKYLFHKLQRDVNHNPKVFRYTIPQEIVFRCDQASGCAGSIYVSMLKCVTLLGPFLKWYLCNECQQKTWEQNRPSLHLAPLLLMPYRLDVRSFVV